MPPPAPTDRKVHIIENSKIKIGMDATRGCGICWLSEGGSARNFLNAYDTGRFIQQSYYGKEDGSNWNGQNWRWNPVQGGSWQCQPSAVRECCSNNHCLTAKITPRNWAGQQLCDDVEFEQCITLQGGTAKCHFTFRYRGDQQHPARHQELPAVFVTRALGTLVFYGGDAPWTGDRVTRLSNIGPPPNKYYKPTEKWAAYVDENNYGVGVFTPACTDLTAYQVGADGSQESNCSYFAPITTMAITPNMVFEYDCYITIGPLPQIRATFAEIAKSL